MVSEPCSGALLPFPHTDLGSEAWLTIPTKDYLSVFWVLLWKVVNSPSALTLGLTPNPGHSLHVFESYQKKLLGRRFL